MTLCKAFRESLNDIESFNSSTLSLLLDFIVVQSQSEQPALIESFIRGPHSIVKMLLQVVSPVACIQLGGVFFRYLLQSPPAKQLLMNDESLEELYQLKSVVMSHATRIGGRNWDVVMIVGNDGDLLRRDLSMLFWTKSILDVICSIL